MHKNKHYIWTLPDLDFNCISNHSAINLYKIASKSDRIDIGYW